ncbi:unnamed protein product [Ilex paraguariensis]|uniref:GH10 domain-containing protein n=1 Tax=Ilex paraguariensis TaxID=185542 RepID=A0ABC8RJ09_9AQUA
MAWLQVHQGKAEVAAMFKTPMHFILAGTVTAQSGCWSMLKVGLAVNTSGPVRLYFELWSYNYKQGLKEERWLLMFKTGYFPFGCAMSKTNPWYQNQWVKLLSPRKPWSSAGRRINSIMTQYSDIIEYMNDGASTPTKYLEKIREIKSNGYNGVLGISLQGHIRTPNLPYMRAAIDQLATARSPIWLTELDVASSPNQDVTDYS